MSKDSFKSFARLHPELADSVVQNKVSWQKLYELYDIYGENSSIWNNYFTTKTTSNVDDIVKTIKGIDIKNIQNGIENIEKALGLLQDIGFGKKETKKIYEQRPLYEKFED